MEPKHTILVVDDEQVVQDAARRILTARGFAVHTVGDAEEALSVLPTLGPDVALIDVMLPGLSGLDLLDRVRAHYPDMVVLVTTGYTSVDHAVTALRGGAFDFLPKPFTFDELLGPIYRACRYLDLNGAAPHSSMPTGVSMLGTQAWARTDDDGTTLLGVTDVFAQTAGRIVHAELPTVNAPVHQGGLLARFEAGDDLIHTAWAAMTGRVLGVNALWQTNPGQALAAPFEAGWIARIAPVNLDDERATLH